MHCSFNTIKAEPNHVLLGLKISISFKQIACQDWFLAIPMLCDRWRGENCLNAMDGCSTDDRDMRPILGLGGHIAKVVHIYLEEFGWHFSSPSHEVILNGH
jgi:hypothetical protein